MSKPFPVPPGMKPLTNREIALAIPAPPGVAVQSHVKPAQPPEIETVDGTLAEDEVQMILKSSLNPEHYRDPVVLKFIQGYLQSRDIGDACIFAGIKKVSGYALRARPDIHNAIARLTTKSLMKFGFDAHEVVEKVKEIQNIDPADLFKADGTYKTIPEMAPEVRRVIKKFKMKYLYGPDANGIPSKIGEMLEIEFWDKMKAAELLSREVDLFKQTTVQQHDVSKNMATVLLSSNLRGAERADKFMKDVTVTARQLPEGKDDGSS